GRGLHELSRVTLSYVVWRLVCVVVNVFFFQAEDGIRDFHVTGVQTCALPISGCRWRHSSGPSCCCASGRTARPSAVPCWAWPACCWCCPLVSLHVCCSWSSTGAT